MQGKAGTKQERLCKEWQTFINAEMFEYHEEGSDFNFPKIHPLLHFGEQIRRYGSLKQWSTETGESSHRTQLKVLEKLLGAGGTALEVRRWRHGAGRTALGVSD